MKKRKPLESTITKGILFCLNRIEQCKAIKIHGSVYQEVGTPDIIGSYRGMMFLLEVKRPGCEVTEIQAYRLKEWGRTGALARVVHDSDEAVRVVRELDDPRKTLTSSQGSPVVAVSCSQTSWPLS